MKITDISAWQAAGSFVKQWDDVDRVCRPLDIYDDYFATRPDRTKTTIGQKRQASLYFIDIETDEGVTGTKFPSTAVCWPIPPSPNGLRKSP
ncbi:hypothetical protein FACS1894110_22290 [Spirochaetia bacterium]|nr:hypothetical protein FACS1894110_22290 [Spirochaetia bacterium]